MVAIILLVVLLFGMCYIIYDATHPSELKSYREYLFEQYLEGKPVEIFDKADDMDPFSEIEENTNNQYKEETAGDIAQFIIDSDDYVKNVMFKIKDYEEYREDAYEYILDEIRKALAGEDEEKIEHYIAIKILPDETIEQRIKDRYTNYVNSLMDNCNKVEKDTEVYNKSFGPDATDDDLHPVEPKTEEITEDAKDIESIDDLISTGTVEDIEK